MLPEAINCSFSSICLLIFLGIQYKQNLDISHILLLTEELLISRFDCIVVALLGLSLSSVSKGKGEQASELASRGLVVACAFVLRRGEKGEEEEGPSHVRPRDSQADEGGGGGRRGRAISRDKKGPMAISRREERQNGP